MKIHNLIQGSQEWLAYRAQHFNASDAPAMMGCSPYKTRAELLREMHSGVAAEVDAGTQKRFDNGHRAEALARPLAEEFIGSELYPVTGSEGRLSASFDGLTLDETEGFEHKALNDTLRAAFKAMEALPPLDDAAACRLLPLHHRVQMEQQLLISGAERILFMASAWTADEDLIEEHNVWYYPDAVLRQQIVDGWAQFDRDLAAYKPAAAQAAEPAKAAPMESLPAVTVRLDGALSVAGNLPTFMQALKAFVSRMPNKPATDDDFATLDAACKSLKKAEEALDAAEGNALASITDVESMRRAVADARKLARDTRLAAEKMVDRRKVEIKEQAVYAARAALDKHIADLNAEIAPMRLQPVAGDFAGAIKGLRSIASMQDALDTTLAAAKISADGQARVIRANVAAFNDLALADDFGFLFADLHLLVHKAADDFAAVVRARIAEHKANEERKRVENDRAERLRNLMSELQGINQQVQIAQIGRLGVRKGGTIDCLRETLAETEAWTLDPAHWGEHLQRAHDAKAGAITAIRNLLGQAEKAAAAELQTAQESQAGAELSPDAQALNEAQGAARFASTHPTLAKAFQAPPAPAQRADEPATLNLGAINEILAPVKVDAAGLALLGITHSGSQGVAKLFRESDIPRICFAIQKHLAGVVARQAVPA